METSMNRRSFLGWPAALAIANRSTPIIGAVQTGPRDSSFDPWVEVNVGHLEHNATQVSLAASKRPILAVIKNNGYGLGVVHAAQALTRSPAVSGVAVIKLQEAMALRDAGLTSPILLMGPFDQRELAEMQARDIMPMVYTEVASDLETVAARSGRPVRVHLCIDTGLGRVGVPFREAASLARDLARRKVVIDGVMMTFTEDQAFDQEQLRRFESVTSELTKSGIALGRRHAASSYTFFQHDNAWLDMVRPGMALYGVYPEAAFRTSGKLDLRPAVALRARVAYVKKLAAGETAGYNRAYVAKADTWIATLPVGHSDGWPRVAAKGARVRIGGAMYPVIASVSASHTIVEIGAEPRVKIGDVATMFDWENGSRPEDVSAACGASVYDLLMHLDGHLPRKTV
jgi:alanine racemase